MTTSQDIRDCLSTIMDPCSLRAGVPASIAEMGLVHAIDVTEAADGAHVSIVLGVTDPTCLMAAVFLAETHERVGALDGVAQVSVSLDHGTLWTPARLDPAYAKRLATHRGSTASASAQAIQ